LEKRFEKLHNVANHAEECVKAIVFHSERLLQENQSNVQSNAYHTMSAVVEDWCDKFAKLGSAMQKVENQYYERLTNNNTERGLL
jgi:hypothetical protein